ncbi:hypothetical protein [uncultured Roseobacter sp.]|uniref:hypothetical protein n=1 Tax=uncultured Roseobacter sp. TaxID=114847 RepID=UPI0026146736|nr:hypothetical protein [uncultured Roseobacter sp.]
MTYQDNQLGFDALLRETDTLNADQKFQRQVASLPDTMSAGIAHCCDLIAQHDAAVLAADVETAFALKDEAHLLAIKLNGGSGILANEDAAGCVLAREAAAKGGDVPLWGQSGVFKVTVTGLRTRIDLDGFFGIGGRFHFWSGFSIRAVDRYKPFFSGTGYRSFLGVHAEPAPDVTPDLFVSRILESHAAQHLKGRLLDIAPLSTRTG